MDSDDPNHSANLHLYGYFLSTSIDFPLLKSSLTRLWQLFGLLHITKTKTPSVYYHFTFQTQTGTTHVLDNSPWLVNHIPIFLNRRSPGSPLQKTQPSSIPIRVSFHNVPLELWTALGISKIASCIGIPKFLDRFTEDRVRYQTGKLGFVRVLIDVPASGKRQDEVQVQFPSINGRPSWVHKVGVKYSWKPPVCSFCQVFGHNLNKCKVSRKAQVLSLRRTRPTPPTLEMCVCLIDHLDAAERIRYKTSIEDEIVIEEEMYNIDALKRLSLPLSDDDASTTEG